MKERVISFLAVGDNIENFEIVSMLADKYDCEVYLARLITKQQNVVLKLSKYTSEGSDYKSNENIVSALHFLQQANTHKILSEHSNIVGLLAQGSFQNHPYIVMPFVCMNLAEYLAKNHQCIDFEESVQIVISVLSALSFMHQQGFVHLDIKPQNILIDDKLQVFLCDFDSVQRIEFDRDTGTENSRQANESKYSPISKQAINKRQKLTPQYAAPEQFDEAFAASPSADLYSLGALWFRLLFASPFSEYENALEHLNLHRQIPSWAKNLITQLVGRHANSRPQSAKHCLNLIYQHTDNANNNPVSTPEDYETIAFDSNYKQQSLSSGASNDLSPHKALENDIDRILVDKGELGDDDLKRLLISYFDSDDASADTPKNSHNSPTSYDAKNIRQSEKVLRLLIEKRIKTLSSDKSLSALFAWVRYLNMVKIEQGENISKALYKQLLNAGTSGSTVSESKLKEILDNKFYVPNVFSFRQVKLRSFIPLLLIIIVFAFWGTKYHLDEIGGVRQTSEDTAIQNENMQRNVSGDTILGMVRPKDNGPQNTINDNVEYADTLGKKQSEVLTKQKVDSLPVNQIIYGDNALTWQYRVAASPEGQEGDIAIIKFIRISENDDFAMMSTEVSENLYRMCIEDGACSSVTSYSTRRAILSDEVNATQSENGARDNRLQNRQPKVNISWYDINQRFIPWLKEKLKRDFALPSFEQWKRINAAYPDSFDISDYAICKTCLAGPSDLDTPVNVDYGPKDPLGFRHVFGNTQEWLRDCWSPEYINAQRKRCDQAMVIGGSFIDRVKSNIHSSPSRLLKSASTPTTGFRLVEELHAKRSLP